MYWNKGDAIADRWKVLKVLGGPGKSGMGVVYVVFDEEQREVFAAKTLQDPHNAKVVARFKQEAVTWHSLNAHPNVARAYFTETIDEQPYIFVEYVGGGDLLACINRRGRMDPTLVSSLAMQFCDGMTHARAHGLIAHRDVKPHNCLLTQGTDRERSLKITDFGLCRFHLTDEAHVTAENSGNEGLTQAGTGLGTLHYMAPEQFTDAKFADVRSDIYAFGITLFHMLSGSVPYTGSPSAIRQQHESAGLPDLDVQRPISRIVRRCTEKDPALRYPGFGELRADLESAYTLLTSRRAPASPARTHLSAQEQMDKGRSLLELGYAEHALKALNRAIDLDASLSLAWAHKANALLKLRRNDEAALCAERASQLDGSNFVFWNLLGQCWLSASARDKARPCFERSLAIEDNYGGVVGKAHAMSGIGDEVIALYKHAIELDPSEPYAYHVLGQRLYQDTQFHVALPFVRRAAELGDETVNELLRDCEAAVTRQQWLVPGSVVEIRGEGLHLRRGFIVRQYQFERGIMELDHGPLGGPYYWRTVGKGRLLFTPGKVYVIHSNGEDVLAHETELIYLPEVRLEQLRPKKAVPSKDYELLILATLCQCAGPMPGWEVLEDVKGKLTGQLSAADYVQDCYGRVRWQSQAYNARRKLTARGLVTAKGNSWKITEAGRDLIRRVKDGDH